MARPRISIPSEFLARPLSRTGEADLLSAADRMDMMDLLNTFNWCLDSAAYDVLATIITDDFTFDRAEGIIEGRDACIEYLRKNPGYYDHFRHENAGMLMRSVDLAHSIVVSYLVVSRCGSAQDNAPSLELAAHGVCVDHLRKEKEIWKLQRRTVDQMALSPSMSVNAEARTRLALAAGER